LIAITKENGKYYLVMKGNPGQANNVMGQTCDKTPGEEYARIPWPGTDATLKVQMYFDNMRDEAAFYYLDNTEWQKIGINQKLYFGLDHFVGCRFGLFMYSTRKIGGKASFSHFVYNQSTEVGSNLAPPPVSRSVGL
jgi:beta-xylosidase